MSITSIAISEGWINLRGRVIQDVIEVAQTSATAVSGGFLLIGIAIICTSALVLSIKFSLEYEKIEKINGLPILN